MTTNLRGCLKILHLKCGGLGEEDLIFSFKYVVGLFALIGKDALTVIGVYFAVSALLLLSSFLFLPSEFLDSVPVLLSVGLLLPLFPWYKNYCVRMRLSNEVNGRGKGLVGLWMVALFLLAMAVRFPSVLWFQVPYEKTPLIYLLVLTMAFIEKTKISAFGLKMRRIDMAVLYGLVYFVVFSFSPVIFFILFVFASVGQLPVQTYDVFSFMWVMPFMMCVGISEEGLFRGYMQTHLERFYSKRKANLLQALLFGLWHIVWYVSTPQPLYMFGYVTITFVIGLFYGYFYSKARNLVPLIIAHGLHNSFLLGLEMNQKVLELIGNLPPLNQGLIWITPYILAGMFAFAFTKYAVKEL
jgi:membrane protease YdiL (CAAX protease family)